MDSGFNNKTVLNRYKSNLFATNPREYSAGIIATFSVSLCLAIVRILSSIGLWEAPFFLTPLGELAVSLIWPIFGGFLLPVALYFMLCKRGSLREKFTRADFKQNFHNFGYRRLGFDLVLLSILLGILYSVANQGIAMITQSIMILLGLNFSYGVADYGGIGHLFVMLFTTAVLPTICEETVDRGILMYSLKKRGERTAIFLTALIFAFTHMFIGQTFYTFAMGLITAYVVVKTGNIIPAMIIHFINNFGGTLFHYLYIKDMPGKEMYQLLIDLSENNPILLVLAWVGALIGAIMLARFMVRYDRQKKDLKKAMHSHAQQSAIANGQEPLPMTDEQGFVEGQFDHYEPYRPKFKEEIFLYAMLIINGGATIFSLIWALM